MTSIQSNAARAASLPATSTRNLTPSTLFQTATQLSDVESATISTMVENTTQTKTTGTCLQPCYCSKQIIYNTSEIEDVVKELIHNLTINKDVTSKSRRKLISVDDTRPSAQGVGLVGVVVLSLILVGIVMFDAPHLFHVLETFKRLEVVW